MWTGQAFSQFGAQVTELAIPVLAVLLLNASEFEVGVLTAANVAAFLIVQETPRRRLDRPHAQAPRHDLGGRGLRARPRHGAGLLWLLGILHIWQLVVVALVMGIATVFFDVSYQSIIPPSCARTRSPANELSRPRSRA